MRDNMTICERIFDIMKKKKLRYKDLAEFIGVGASTVSEWKKRGTTPSAEYIYPISQFLNVNIKFLLTGEDRHFKSLSSRDDYEYSFDELCSNLRSIFDTFDDAEYEQAYFALKNYSYYFEILNELKSDKKKDICEIFLEGISVFSDRLFYILHEVYKICVFHQVRDYKKLLIQRNRFGNDTKVIYETLFEIVNTLLYAYGIETHESEL